MTYDDDFIRIEFETGKKDIMCETVGLTWPPPIGIEIYGFRYVRVEMSGITDEQREKMTHVCRSALYILAPACQQEDAPTGTLNA